MCYQSLMTFYILKLYFPRKIANICSTLCGHTFENEKKTIPESGALRMLEYGYIGLSEYWNVRMSDSQNIGMSGSRNIWMREHLVVGTLGCGKNGMWEH